MARHRNLFLTSLLAAALFACAACNVGPSVSGNFDRNYSVAGPIRLELTNASGDVDITGSADGNVHVRGEVRVSGMGAGSSQKRLDATIANPPIEQKGDTIRIGKELSNLRNISIAYTIQVPHDTEVSVTVASGAQTIRGVRGPVKVQAASGAIRVEKIDRDTQLTTASGSVSASDVGDDVQITSASGSVKVSNAKGDVRVNAIAGTIQIARPGGRVEADTASGQVDVQGASNNVKAHAVSGRVVVQGDPAANSYWELKTASGSIQLNVPAAASFHLSAQALSGEIRTDVPIMIEEQGKHSLRARMGNGGARVDVQTVSGEIRVSGAN
jgi:DUF4097 and DUF4098 domain-containing protein YvlB